MPQSPCHRRCLARDIGQLLGIGPLVDRRVGEEHGVVLADHQVDTEGNVPRLRIEHHVHLARGLAEGARHAGDHRIALSDGQQRRGKGVALLIDHAAHVTLGEATALQPLVEIIDHLRHVFAGLRVLDLETVGIVDRQLDQLFADLVGPADQHRRTVAEITELDRGAQHDVLFRFGKDNALGRGFRALIYCCQYRCGRVEARLQ